MRIPLQLVIVITFLSSCTSAKRFVYAPAPSVNPYFKESGDSKLEANYTGGDYDQDASAGRNTGYDIQSAYAITRHWAVTFDYFSRKEQDVYNTTITRNYFDSSIVNYKRRVTSIGGGYFIGLTKKNKVTFNLYGGIGFGKFTINDNGLDNSSAPYSRFHQDHVAEWYLQPGLNFMPGKYFWCSISAKLNVVKYSRIKTSYDWNEADYFHLDNLNQKILTYWEPSFNMQIGVPHCNWLKICAGVAVSSDISSYKDSDKGRYYLSRTDNAYVGLNFNFSKIHKTQKHHP